MIKENVKQIGIVGTGMIGTSLAVLTSGHGIDTVMFALNEDFKKQSYEQYEKFLSELKGKEIINDDNIKACKKNLDYTYTYEGLKDCDLIFEAVIEDLSVKQSVYKEIEDNCKNIKAICSVSSAIEVNDLANGLKKYSDRIIVAHPFFPPHIVPYFEISRGDLTDNKVVFFVKDLLEKLDRKPVILKKSLPGFIGNRLQFAIWREALNMVEEGVADPEDIDKCLMYSFCPRYTSIGMFEHFDNGGLELNYQVCKSIFPTLSNKKDAPKILTDLIEKGYKGRPYGKGFYDWSKIDMDDFRARIGNPYWKFLHWEWPK